MKFEALDAHIIQAQDRGHAMFAVSGTTIETKVGPFWRTDGYDDKVPVLEAR